MSRPNSFLSMPRWERGRCIRDAAPERVIGLRSCLSGVPVKDDECSLGTSVVSCQEGVSAGDTGMLEG